MWASWTKREKDAVLLWIISHGVANPAGIRVVKANCVKAPAYHW